MDGFIKAAFANKAPLINLALRKGNGLEEKRGQTMQTMSEMISIVIIAIANMELRSGCK